MEVLMSGSPLTRSIADDEPLITGRHLNRLVAATAVLALLTTAVGLASCYFGEHISLAGYTESTEEFTAEIGPDRITLPENVVRFRHQRRNGTAERLDLSLAWPGLSGYTAQTKALFTGAGSSPLIFLQLSPRTMSRDMSERLDPVYAKLFDGHPHALEGGLTLHRLRPNSGYGNETILTGRKKDGSAYVVRCLLPAAGERRSNADCQRDIHVGQDLTVLYRFSSALLHEWQHIDAAVRLFVEQRLTR